ncbi:MAG TPA: PQQ-dependent sugar dehydrogenase [Gaiellaceae bacterium]|nr:PQQ-dependent sugar dehydrogenase [Gaiellaceae bacterium]
MRRARTALAGLLLAGVVAAPASGALRLAPVASGFSNPVHLASTPAQSGRLYVVQQGGVIRIVQNGQVRSTPFLNISDLVTCCGEQGLLSLAFHPRFAQNHRVFVNYTNRAGDTRVVGLRTNANGTRALRRTLKVWLRVDQPYSNHQGGQVAFGNDGRLYVGMGDGGSAGDPGNRAQRLTSRLGKLLRINVDRPSAKASIVALGLRNPWRFSVDPSTGHFYVADVGQGEWEEIDIFRPGARGLENYGWRVYEGNRHLYDNSRGLRRPSILRWPIHEYSHGGSRCSVTGGFVGRTSGVPSEARGRYFFGDYCTGDVWSFRWARGHKTGFRREPFTVPGNLSSFGLGSNGGIYLLSHNGGSVYRLAAQ